MTIHTVAGRKFHVGGRLLPRLQHGLKLHSPRYGLNLVSWPATPSSTAWGAVPGAQPCLTDILGNDQYGDCTEADQYHRQALRQAAAGNSVFYPSVDQVLATYSRDGGFDPANPTTTDNGCDETVVLGNDVSQGITDFGGLAKAAGFIQLDGSNSDLIRAVVAAFPGGTPICANVADSWIQAVQGPGFVWDVPSDGFNPSNGHCFTLADFDQQSALIWAWGIQGRLTWAALAACTSTSNGGALYLVCDAEVLNAASQKAPDGLDWAALLDDFNSLGGTVPAPAPGPQPPAPPQPTPAMLGLGDVQALLTQNWPTSS